tara:strand:- start:458 stop:1426 length:969 start_codon:yes stop_codon:yes gene_type:complete
METVFEDIKPRIAQPPETKGMFVLSIGHIAMSQIEGMHTDVSNVARKDGPDQLKINDHMRNIRDGHYIGEHHVPPVVVKIGTCPKTGKDIYKLIDGEHRYNAHRDMPKEAGVTHMWVAVCVFDDEEAMLNYKSNANNHKKTYVANERTEDDVCIIIKRIIELKGYDLTTTQLNDLLKNQNVGKGDYAYYRSKIKGMMDRNTNVVKIFTPVQAHKEALKRYPNQNFTVQAYHRLADGQEENTSFSAAIQLKIDANDPALPAYIVAHVKKQDEKGLLEIRPRKDKNLDVWLKKICQMADVIRADGFTRPVLDFLPQTRKDLGVK